MFDDDVGNNFESTFREAYDDATTRQYPTALKDVMGEEEQKNLLTSHRKRDMGQLFVAAARFVQGRTGLSENVVTILFASFVVIGAPFSLLMAFMVVNGISKRRMEQEFKQRYGDSYSVDATLKPEDTVEAPPDEEDDDGDDDEEDGDDDDE